MHLSLTFWVSHVFCFCIASTESADIVFSTIEDQVICRDSATEYLPFSIQTAISPSVALTVSAFSDNQTLISNDGINLQYAASINQISHVSFNGSQYLIRVRHVTNIENGKGSVANNRIGLDTVEDNTVKITIQVSDQKYNATYGQTAFNVRIKSKSALQDGIPVGCGHCTTDHNCGGPRYGVGRGFCMDSVCYCYGDYACPWCTVHAVELSWADSPVCIRQIPPDGGGRCSSDYDCYGNGQCIGSGRCLCYEGWTCEYCDQAHKTIFSGEQVCGGKNEGMKSLGFGISGMLDVTLVLAFLLVGCMFQTQV